MPDITVPNTFTDGTVLSAAELNENTFSPRVTPAGAEVANGRLDEDNLPVGAKVRRYDARKGSCSNGRSVGATASKDYFADLFTGLRGADSTYREGALADGPSSGSGDRTDPSSALTPHHRFLPVAGASIEFYLPYDCEAVYLNWHLTTMGFYPILTKAGGVIYQPKINVGTTNALAAYRSTLRLFIDDSPVYHCSKRLYDTPQEWVPDKDKNLTAEGNRPGLRFWNGMYLVEAGGSLNSVTRAGWHSVSIRVAVEDGIWKSSNYAAGAPVSDLPEYLHNQVRAFNTRMGYVYIR